MCWRKIFQKVKSGVVDFAARTGFGIVNSDKKMILFGGYSPNSQKYLNNVWESEY
ncbi:MAG: Kelch repeat-containing protein [Brevinema sp.]